MNIDPFLIWMDSTALSQSVVGSVVLAFPDIRPLRDGWVRGRICLALDQRILGIDAGFAGGRYAASCRSSGHRSG